MKRYPAISVLEFTDIPTGMFVTDAMVKKAPITVLKSGTVSPGRYLTMIGGSTASVEESHREGVELGGAEVCDQVLLADVDPSLHDGLLGARQSAGDGALAVLETPTVASILLATERALKAADVHLVEVRAADSLLAGKGLAILGGALTDIQAAVDAARNELTRVNRPLTHRIVTAPHPTLSSSVSESTRFGEAPLAEPPDAEGSES